jgi:hypothetical protein
MDDDLSLRRRDSIEIKCRTDNDNDNDVHHSETFVSHNLLV